MAAGRSLANKPDSAKLGETELTIDYTIPELIHSIELVQRQVRIQWSTSHRKGAPLAKGNREESVDWNLRMCYVCQRTDRQLQLPETGT
ncbi:hypothetical protein SAMN05216404_10729 [Nitrosospira multiformis]|uniref:Uncharacterized protein n=1 Tax=Nitrosospira multiformis TaxID=1231 RepID=A0A1H8JBN8_9PROT|nr:hypothetical protein SAMN05216404_10729 [Nitrosospira multiformis]